MLVAGNANLLALRAAQSDSGCHAASWRFREQDQDTLEDLVTCRAFDENENEIGTMAIDGDGLIMWVEVLPDHRRQGIATRMLEELTAAGYQVKHDWGENMRADGAAWARSFEGSTDA